MNNFVRRSIGLLLALVMIAAQILVGIPAPVNAADVSAQASTGRELTQYIQDGATLQCWNWSFNNIKANLGLIANLGYSTIQVSPPQEGKEGTVNKPFENWWVLYQPISFNINENENNAIGTRDEFIALCDEAHKYGIRVIVDVISNHLADDGTANIEPSPLIPSDILNDRSCWHAEYNVQSSNYRDRYDITHRAMKLPDLNTGSDKIQNYVLNLLKDLIDCGADGFRYDAAKQIETPDDYYTYASDFWPTVINGATDYAASTRGIMLYNYGEMLANPDESGSLPVSAYTKYMSVTENAWSNDIRHFMYTGNAGAIQYSYFKQCNADKLVLWPESHDTFWDGYVNEDESWYYGPSQQYSHEVNSYVLNRTYALVASRAYAMSLYFARANDMLYQEMGDIAKTGWSDPAVKAVNWFKNAFVGTSEYCSTYGNFAYIERGDSGVVIINVPGGASWASVPNHVLKTGTYKDQVTGNTFTVSSDGWIYGDIGDTGVAVIYNAEEVSCSHSSHGSDGYCYNCYEYVGHKSGSTCSVCGTASTKTLYFENNEGWSNVYIYGWHDSSSAAVTNAWPGNKMTLVEGNIYKATVPASASNVIFNNGNGGEGNQTFNLTPSVEGDTYDSATGYWTYQGEVITADHYYLFGYINGVDYNGSDYRFTDGKLTTTFAQDSYVFVCDSNGVEYMTEGAMGDATSATLKPVGSIASGHDKLKVPGGVQVTLTLTPNADGTITLSYVTGGAVDPQPNPGSTTIYFKNTAGWSTPYIYAWSDSGDTTNAWPGNAMTKVAGETDVYSYTLNGYASKIIFHDNSGTQTSDLVIPTDGKNMYTYSSNNWSNYTPSSGGNTGGGTTTTTQTIYFDNSGKNWSKVNVYAWTGETPYTGVWPGSAMTKVSGSIYSFEVPTDATSIIFNDGTNQTADMIIPTDGKNQYSSATNAWSVYSAGGNTGGNTGGSTTTGDYYLFYATNTDSYNGYDYHFVNGKLTMSFKETSYVWVINNNDGVQYMTDGWQGEVTSVTLKQEPALSSPNKLVVPAGTELTFTLVENSNGTLTLSYSTDGSSSGGGDTGSAADYYLFGYINGANYGCDEDHANLGIYKFVDGKLTTTFDADSYVAIKTGDNANWYMAQSYISTTSGTFYNTSTGTSEKMFVPGGVEVTFTLVKNADGSLTLSYVTAGEDGCSHSYTSKVTTAATCLGTGVKTYTCSKCGDSYSETIPATGHDYEITVVAPTCENNGYTVNKCVNCGYSHNTNPVNPIGHDYSSVVTAPTCTEKGYTTYTCANCGNVYTWNETAATGHSFVGGSCAVCGEVDPDYVLNYYLVGNINGVNYGCDEDYENMGQYKFVDGTLTATFKTDSYVYIKTTDNAAWYMTQSYTTGKVATLYNTNTGSATEKLYVPGGVEVIFSLVENANGTLTLSYMVNSNTCDHTNHNIGGQCTLCDAYVDHSYEAGYCTVCGAAQEKVDYYLFGNINGSDYATGEELGEYKFVDGILTVTFTEDSYVAVKTDDNAHWYMTNGWVGEISSVTLYDMNPDSVAANKLYVPGGKEITFSLVENAGGTLTLSYTIPVTECEHPKHDVNGLCTVCGTSVEHTYTSGFCSICRAVDPNYSYVEYYLFGYINGTNYGEYDDASSTGYFRLYPSGELNTFAKTFDLTTDSYIAVKTGDNSKWYMTDGYQEGATSVTLYDSTTLGENADKLYVPAGRVTVTLVKNADGTMTLSYTQISVPDPEPDPVVDYYLVGYINGANYGCEEDHENLGEYKFVDGKLTAAFDTDSYVFIKTGDNANWYLTEAYVSDTTGTFVTGGTEKMLIPGGVEVTMTLVENDDGSLTLSYVVNGEQPDPVGPTYYLAGTMNGWAEKNADYQLEKDGDVYKITVALATGAYEFKITDGTWNNAWPSENYYLNIPADSNVTITFNPATGEITVDGIEDAPVVKDSKDIKWQITSGTNANSSSTNLRLVSWVDSVANYSSVTFNVTINGRTAPLVCTTAYTAIKASGLSISNPAGVFGEESANYFVTHTIMGIPAAMFDSEILVTVTWTDLEGNTRTSDVESIVISNDWAE